MFRCVKNKYSQLNYNKYEKGLNQIIFDSNLFYKRSKRKVYFTSFTLCPKTPKDKIIIKHNNGIIYPD
jgi:hypothetical protein